MTPLTTLLKALLFICFHFTIGACSCCNKQSQPAKGATPLTTLLKAQLFICIQFTGVASTKTQILTPDERMDKAGGEEEQARRPHVWGGCHALQDELGGA